MAKELDWYRQFDITNIIQGKVLNKIDLKSKSTNIHFESKNIKPNTRMYAFFDGKEVTNYCIPKLLEISMIEGVFQSGETVEENDCQWFGSKD